MKRLLLLILIMGLGVTVVYAHDFSSETVFLSDVGGGNITFAYNCTFSTFTVAGNQARFTVFEMDSNGTWTRLGFRNPWANATMNITHAGENYLVFDVTVAGPTVFEVWLPDDGEPDTITGAAADNWASPTLEVTMNGNGTVILEWEEDEEGDSDQTELFNTLLSYLILAAMIPFIVAVAYALHLLMGGEFNIKAVIIIISLILAFAIIATLFAKYV